MTAFVEVKVAELSGAALDYAVAHATKAWGWAHSLFPTMTLDPTFAAVEAGNWPRGEYGASIPSCILVPRNPMRQERSPFCPSTEWSHGGPLIEKHCIELADCAVGIGWYVRHRNRSCDGDQQFGETLLIAVCRAICAAKLGSTVSVPAELVGGV